MANHPYYSDYCEVWVGIKLQNDNELMYCNFGMQKAATGSLIDADAQRVMALFHTGIQPVFGNQYSVTGTFMRDGVGTNPTIVPPFIHAYSGAASVGTYTAANLSQIPQNCALLVNKMTTLGKSGRAFIPGLYESGVTNSGSMDPTEQTRLQGIFNNLYAAIVADPAILAPAIYVKGVMLTVNSFIVQPVIGTQRRRLRK